jgi:hypothetical protein
VPIVISHYDFLDTKEKVFEAGSVDLTILDPVQTRGLAEKDADSLAESIRNQVSIL